MLLWVFIVYYVYCVLIYFVTCCMSCITVVIVCVVVGFNVINGVLIGVEFVYGLVKLNDV